MRILLTGCAGFVGFHAAKRLLSGGHSVIGLDNLNDYYDPALKQARLEVLSGHKGFSFHHVDLTDQDALQAAVQGQDLTHILHLAAQAGVRYSLENPHSYTQSNIIAHLNILELARHMTGLQHLVYASSSSVYGNRKPADSDGEGFKEDDVNRSPASLYAATKISGEILSESYARLYDIPMTGLRFFTVYGPYGRPRPDDGRRHALYNLGNSGPARLNDLVAAVEQACGRAAITRTAPKQAGDVTRTFANIDKARKDFGFDPKTRLEDGIKVCVDWYQDYLQRG